MLLRGSHSGSSQVASKCSITTCFRRESRNRPHNQRHYGRDSAGSVVCGSVPIAVIVVAVSPAAIRALVSHTKAALISVTIAILEGLNRPHPPAISMTRVL